MIARIRHQCLALIALFAMSISVTGEAAADEVCRGNTVDSQRVRAASAYALTEAGSATDATKLLDAFDAYMTTHGEPNPERFRPSSGGLLATDPEYVADLKRLFESYSTSSPATDDRVIGGCPAEKSTDVVAVFDTRNARLTLCTGVLVKPNRVLTAAHCMCPLLDGIGKSVQVWFGPRVFDTAPFKVAGVRSVDFLFGDGGCPRAPAELKDRYRTAYLAKLQREIIGKDFAVLRLDERISATIATPRKTLSTVGFNNAVAANRPVSVAGFGFFRPGEGAGVRRWGGIAIADWTCTRLNERIPCEPGKEIIASTMAVSKTATCNHDSGGPLYVFTAAEGPRLAGITSRNVTGECGEGAIYGIVSTPEVMQWLSSVGAL